MDNTETKHCQCHASYRSQLRELRDRRAHRWQLHERILAGTIEVDLIVPSFSGRADDNEEAQDVAFCEGSVDAENQRVPCRRLAEDAPGTIGVLVGLIADRVPHAVNFGQTERVP